MIFFIFFILILLSALFASAETAIFSLRESQVRLMEKSLNNNAKLIARLKRDPHRVLVTLLFGNTIVNVTVGSLAALFTINETHSLGIGITTGIATILLLLFGEIFPKSFAISHNKKVAQWIAYPIYLFYLAFYPFASIFVMIERLLKHISGSTTHDNVTEEEIRVMSDIGLEHGGIDHDEHKLIDNIFQFDDIPVGKAMTAKGDIDSLNGDVPVTQIAYYVSQYTQMM
jgi:putative hemolysin